MTATTPSDSGISILFVEGAFAFVAFAVAFAWPRFFESRFSRIKRMLGRLARLRMLAVVAMGLCVIVLRLAILPWMPIPLPFVPDDFSFLLGADTFLHGRLANHTPAMWVHFETIHVDMLPTYVSMYFPGQALALAAGKMLLGNPWYAQLVSSALMCASLCWMLQAWLPPRWALLGGMIAVFRLGLYTYWINTYTGGGCLAALGGALVLGSLPRLKRTVAARYGVLMGIGMALLVLTRPYEGLLLCLPVTAALLHWLLKGANRPNVTTLLKRAAPGLAIVAATIAWLGFYDYRAFGSPTTLPYTINRASYAVAPYYIWQSPRPQPSYRHEALRSFYNGPELDTFRDGASFAGFASATAVKLLSTFVFFAGFLLLPPLLMIRRVFLDKRIRFLCISVLVYLPGMMIQVFLLPHYLAPFTATFYAIGLQAMRHLRLWEFEGKPVGLALVRIIVLLCVAFAAARPFAPMAGLAVAEWPGSNWMKWYGPDHYGTERASIQSRLASLPGKQLAFVRFGPKRNSLDQWVYNGADIDASKVIWARQMDAASDLELMRYYKGRAAWLVQMDTEPASVSPYPLPVQVFTEATQVTR